MKTHISYKTAKILKEFLGNDATEPMDNSIRWRERVDEDRTYLLRDGDPEKGLPAYQLHDLLSRGFCDVMAEKTGYRSSVIGDRLCNEYRYEGGLLEVEQVLADMCKK